MRIAMPALLSSLFYGGPRRNTLPERLFGARWFLAVAGLPMLLGLAMCLLLQVVDPYDLRPWGMAPKFADANYPDLQTSYFVAARAREPHDLLVFGGSTTMPLSPGLLRQVFGAKTPANLSYSLPAPDDTAAVLGNLVRSPGLNRLIVGVDHSQMRNDSELFLTGSTAISMFNSRWFDMPDFNLRTVTATFNRARGRTLDIPNWRVEPASFVDAPRLTDRADMLAYLYDAIVRPAPGMFVSPRLPDCRSYSYIRKVVLPVGSEAKRRGVLVDLVIPPIPFATYYSWQKNELLMSNWTAGSHYRQLVHFHQCIARAAAAAGLDNVRVHATAIDTALAGDFTNYRDTVHLTAPRALERLMTDVRDRRFVLNANNLAAYAKKMDADVASARKLFLKRQPAPMRSNVQP